MDTFKVIKFEKDKIEVTKRELDIEIERWIERWGERERKRERQ